MSDTNDERKRHRKRKDAGLRAEEEEECMGIPELVVSTGLLPAAALCSMESPTVKEVVSRTSTTEFGGTIEPNSQHGTMYDDVYSIAVPSKRPSGNSDSDRSVRKAESGPDDQSQTNETDRKKRKKVLISLLIVGLVAASWTGSTQFSKSSLTSPTFKAPYFLVWFNTNWQTACFPLYVFFMSVTLACHRKKSSNVMTPYRVIRDAPLVYGPSGLTLKAILTRTVPFTVIWTVANYSYSQALLQISAAETTIVFSSNLAFVYLLSWIFLHDKFLALRTLAMLLAIVGIVLMVHAEGIGTMTFVGVVCAVIASAASAIYKVLFKRIIGNANFGQVSLFMSLLGLCNLLTSWPIMLILMLTGAESVQWDEVPWRYICGSASLGLVYNLLVNVGVAYTHPVYVSMGIFLGLPLNATVDAVWRGMTLGGLQIVGAVCIVLSFLILLLPEDFASSVLRRLGITRQ